MVPPPRASTLLSPMILVATLAACSTVSWAFPMVVRVSAFATSFLGRAFLKRLRQSACLNQRIGVVTGGGVPLSELARVFGTLGRSFRGPLPPQSYDKLANLKVSSSMIKKVNLT